MQLHRETLYLSSYQKSLLFMKNAIVPVFQPGLVSALSLFFVFWPETHDTDGSSQQLHWAG